MQSQQMFNDCIARTRSLAGTGSFLNSRQNRQNVTSAVRDQGIQCPATPSTYISIEKGCSTYFPASDSEKEAQHIGLLLLL